MTIVIAQVRVDLILPLGLCCQDTKVLWKPIGNVVSARRQLARQRSI
ncbi:hypothetical protein [Sphingomonas sp. Leaf33]|nr:hypothetical protein [Sphingomonas sp. Leaf33]